MGKRKHIKTGAGDMIRAPGGLADQIETNTFAQQRSAPRGILKKSKQESEFVPDGLSAKILREAAKQIAREEPKTVPLVKPQVLLAKDVASQLRKKRKTSESSDEDGDIFKDDEEEFPDLSTANPPELPDFLHDDDEDASDGRILKDFASVVLERADRKKALFEQEFASGPADPTAGLSDQVVAMYKEIGDYMSHYRSGKIPKAFKTIPALKNWEQILEITCPDRYTAAAMLHATRQFAANAAPKACERFYQFYLLPRVLDDIMEFRKLNVLLFTALKKAVYKPTAFVKGILLPMCEPDAISMNAAHVIKAVIQSTSLPVFHAATAMIKLAQNRPPSSAVSYVLSGFLQKRYTLPSLAVSALLDYVCAFEDAEERMPLTLHSLVHTFVQHYKLELDPQQKQRLHKALMDYGNKNARKDTLSELDPLLAGPPAEAMDES